MIFSDTVRTKKPVSQPYRCPVCQRMSAYAGPCSLVCRERATPTQAKPYLAAPLTARWDPK